MNDLTHTGVKGMHWGQRKAKTPSSKKPMSKQRKKEWIQSSLIIGGSLAAGILWAHGSSKLKDAQARRTNKNIVKGMRSTEENVQSLLNMSRNIRFHGLSDM